MFWVWFDSILLMKVSWMEAIDEKRFFSGFSGKFSTLSLAISEFRWNLRTNPWKIEPFPSKYSLIPSNLHDFPPVKQASSKSSLVLLAQSEIMSARASSAQATWMLCTMATCMQFHPKWKSTRGSPLIMRKVKDVCWNIGKSIIHMFIYNEKPWHWDESVLRWPVSWICVVEEIVRVFSVEWT